MRSSSEFQAAGPETPAPNPRQEARMQADPAVGWPRTDLYQDLSRRKSPPLAAILSLMPGLGQVYVGYYQQGFINIIVVGSLISFLASGAFESLVPLAALFLAFFWLYNLVDAGRKAALYNQALLGMGPGKLPEQEEAPGTRGSLLGGIALVLFGIMLFAHTRFNVPLEWLEQWWPLALVAAGAYLIYKAALGRQDRPADIRREETER
jgi:TM2 domain-containing membrane protein YozV